MKIKKIVSCILIFVMTFLTAAEGFTKMQNVQVSAATDPVEENVYYNITNVYTGRLMDIPSGTDADGTLLHTWKLNGGTAQQFIFVKSGEEGYYEIVPRVASTRALDNPSGSTTAGTQYQTYTQNHTDSQKFKLESDGNGNYRIINKKSGMALTDMNVPNDEEVDAVQQHPVDAGDKAQLWKFSKYPNTYTFINPIKPDGADPWVIQAGEKYYLCYTNGSNKIYLRAMDKFENMRSYSDKIVYTAPEEGMYSAEIWAPELLWVDGRWYIYFAADDGTNANHRMYVLEGGTNPDNPLDGNYTFKGKIYDTSNDRWAIDGTVFNYGGQNYFVWSGWDTTNGNVQNLYIATMSNAWTLSSSRVCISEPTNSWEKSGSSSINEGPQVLIKGSKVHIVYSAAGSWTNNYCLGVLTCSDGNFLKPSSWVKSSNPAFQKTENVFGVGHASFVKSKDGTEDWIIYHSARWNGSKWTRHINTQLFTWTDSGYPFFGEPVDQAVSLTRPSTDSTPIVNTTNYYKIVNVGTGRTLDIPNKGDENRVKLQTYANNNTIAQRFRFKSTGDAGWYNIIPKCAQTRALDNPSSSKERDITYQIYTQNNSNAQQFKLQHVGDGKYRIINKASLFALTDTYEVDGGYVEQRMLQNDDSQLWEIVCMTDEETYEEMTDVVVTDDSTWTSVGAWSYYFGSWNNSNGTYSGGATADKFFINITSNNKSQWGIQLALDNQPVVSGHEYQYTLNVNSSSAGSILSKDDVSNSIPVTTSIVAGDNVITGTFTAGGDTAKILLEIAAGIDVGTTLKFTGLSLVDLTAQEEITTEESTIGETTTKAPATEKPTTVAGDITYDENGFATSSKIDLLGYQISTGYEGFRVVGLVEPEIEGKKVANWGIIYGLNTVKGNDTGITNTDMYVGSNNQYVKAYQSTSQGTASVVMGTSQTATYFVRTMSFGTKTSDAFQTVYKARAYAVLEDGTYVYSSVGDFSVYDLAKTLYDNCLMNTYETHNYLYDTILSKVNVNYKIVDFEWGNTVLQPY